MFKQYVVGVIVLMVYNAFWTIPAFDSGEFKLIITNLSLCKGPKRKECCVNNVVLLNSTCFRYEMHVIEEIMPTQGKLLVYRNGKLLWRLLMKNPCDHLFFRPMFRTILNISQDCRFKKGNHVFHVNMNDVEKYYHGEINLYGNATVKITFFSEDCNLSCTVTQLKSIPKYKTDV